MVIKQIKKDLTLIKEATEMMARGYAGKVPKFDEIKEIREILKEMDEKSKELDKYSNLLKEGKISSAQYLRETQAYLNEIGKRVDYINNRLYGKKKLK